MTDGRGRILKELEILSDKLSQKPIMEFEGFVIRPFDGWNLWFEHPSGEGTQIQKAKFLGALAKLFKETF
jgi:hypothetical protein